MHHICNIQRSLRYEGNFSDAAPILDKLVGLLDHPESNVRNAARDGIIDLGNAQAKGDYIVSEAVHKDTSSKVIEVIEEFVKNPQEKRDIQPYLAVLDQFSELLSGYYVN